MKELDDRLRRLLKSAAAAPREIPAEPPFGFTTRVLASLRAARRPMEEEEETPFSASMFRRALACGFALMLVTLAATYHTLTAPINNEVQIANSAIEMNLP